MSADTITQKLFAMCPPWLWPVLAYSLISLHLRRSLLLEAGATDIIICMTDWGWAYIAHVHWADAPVSPLDGIYRRAMGEPVPESKWTPASLGICSDEVSADWAAGTGWYSFVGCMEGEARYAPSSVTTSTAGAYRFAPCTLRVLAPP